MLYLWAAILVFINTLWLLLVVFGLPGTWLMAVSTALLAWWRWEDHAADQAPMFTVWTVAALLILAVIGEVLEFFAGVAGTSKAGGSKLGAYGALIGGLLGAIAATPLIPIPILGSLLGACGGACVGAWAFELLAGRKMGESVKSGVGAGVGVFAGRFAKVVVGVLMWLIATVAAFWP